MKMKIISLVTISIFLLSCNQTKINLPGLEGRSKKSSEKKGNSVEDIAAIHIIPLGKVEEKIIEDIVRGLTDFYHKKIVVEKPVPLDTRLLATSKKRYSGDSILKRFNSSTNTVVVTEVDIVTPKKGVTNEWGVFGLGFRPGTVCVISSSRLKKNASPKIFTERLQKVSIHEVGHNLGLDHCTKDPECMMNAAKGTVKQVDLEKIMFCKNCTLFIGL